MNDDVSGHTISEIERLQRLRLIRSENVGPVTYYSMVERFGSAAAALAAILERLAAYHQELEVLGVSREQLVETCARIVHQIVTGRSAT